MLPRQRTIVGHCHRMASKQELDIRQEKERFQRSKQTADVCELRKIIVNFYSRILDLTDAVIGLREDRTILQRERDMLTENNMVLDHELTGNVEELRRERTMRVELQGRLSELESTASQLTAWNSSLEAEKHRLRISLQQEMEKNMHQMQVYKEEILAVTRKMIIQWKDLDQVEDELCVTRCALKETQEIKEKVIRENLILKSKLSILNNSNNNGTIAERISPHTWTSRTSPDLLAPLDTVELSNVANTGMASLIHQLKVAKLSNKIF